MSDPYRALGGLVGTIDHTTFGVSGALGDGLWSVAIDGDQAHEARILNVNEAAYEQLTKDTVLREMDLARVAGKRCIIRVSPALRGALQSIVESLEVQKRDGHDISGLTSHEAHVLQRVLADIRVNPDAALVTVSAEEKQRHKEFVAALGAGELAVYLAPEAAAKCIRRRKDATPVLAFGRFPEAETSDVLAARIDKALRDAEPPLRTVVLEGLVEEGDGGEFLAPNQPMIGGKPVAAELEALDGSTVNLKVGHLIVGGKLSADGHGYEGDEVEPPEPPEVTISGLDLLAYLRPMQGSTQPVTLIVEETERVTGGVQPASEHESKTPEEDLVGKIRVALSAAKLIQVNRLAPETPIGEPAVIGAPSRKNDTAVDRLTEALAWAEQDADEKGRPAE